MLLSSPLPLISFQHIISQEMPPVDWLVKDLLANQDRVVVFGEFGSMKSWLLLDLAIAIASGQAWLGQFDIPRPKSVLYVDEEMNERLLRRRIRQLSIGVEQRREEIPFRAMSLRGFTAGSEADVQALLQALEGTGFSPDVIILETLRRVMVGSELDAEDVGTFWRNLRPLQQAGKTIIVSHHMRKPTMQGRNDVRHRASGSTDILGAADTAFAVTRTDRSRVLLEFVKSRNAEEPQNFAACMANGEHEARRWQFDRFEVSDSHSLTEQRRAFDLIVQYLTDIDVGVARPGQIKQHVLSQGIQPRTCERAWRQVKDSGKVEQVGRWVWRLRATVQQPAA